MIDSIFIFGAKYLFVLSPIVGAVYFFRTSREEKVDMMIFAFFSLPLTFILSIAAKALYFNPLPFVVKGIEPLLTHAPNNGFPSDHVLLLASIASVLTFFNRKVTISLWIVTLLVGISRIYVGVHHSVDILASIIIALISASAVYAVLRWRKSV